MKLHEEFKLYETMWEEAGKPYRLSCASTDLDDAITLGKVPMSLKNVKEVELIDWGRVPVNKYNQICKFLHELGIKVTKGASGREPAKVVAKRITEGWYGADSEVEFETSVYPDIAKYFGLKEDEVVTYAYYYTDEVIVNYDDATGRSHEIEKHVPIDQVEEWFKAGYTILDEGQINSKKLKESTAYTEKDFAWDEVAIVADFKRAALAYMNGANLEDALHDIKVMIISGACAKLDPADTKGLFRRECTKYGIK